MPRPFRLPSGLATVLSCALLGGSTAQQQFLSNAVEHGPPSSPHNPSGHLCPQHPVGRWSLPSSSPVAPDVQIEFTFEKYSQFDIPEFRLVGVYPPPSDGEDDPKNILSAAVVGKTVGEVGYTHFAFSLHFGPSLGLLDSWDVYRVGVLHWEQGVAFVFDCSSPDTLQQQGAGSEQSLIWQRVGHWDPSPPAGGGPTPPPTPGGPPGGGPSGSRGPSGPSGGAADGPATTPVQPTPHADPQEP